MNKKILNEILLNWNNTDLKNEKNIINVSLVPCIPKDTLTIDNYKQVDFYTYKCKCKINWYQFFQIYHQYILDQFYVFSDESNIELLNEYIDNELKDFSEDYIIFYRKIESKESLPESDVNFDIPGENLLFYYSNPYYPNFNGNITLRDIIWEICIEQIEPYFGENDCYLKK